VCVCRLWPTAPTGPPAPAELVRVEVERAPLFLAGRYTKHVRTLSQTPWVRPEDGGRAREASSVYDWIAPAVQALFVCQGRSAFPPSTHPRTLCR
jgi:tRNA U54 and U55 pseudouridine synthase Pus10